MQVAPISTVKKLGVTRRIHFKSQCNTCLWNAPVIVDSFMSSTIAPAEDFYHFYLKVDDRICHRLQSNFIQLETPKTTEMLANNSYYHHLYVFLFSIFRVLMLLCAAKYNGKPTSQPLKSDYFYVFHQNSSSLTDCVLISE